MILYPAIDLLGGSCVRLLKGDYNESTTYGTDPVAQALQFAAEGAGWIHMVDLDAARSGTATNHESIAAICAAVDLPVQVGGGVRSVAAAEALADLGVSRVVIGTAAVENPDLVARVSERQPVAVGLDARDGLVAIHGWTETSDVSVSKAASRFADVGVEAIIATDIARDGTMDGPDAGGVTDLLTESIIPIIASGGVGSLDDLVRLDDIVVPGTSGERRLDGVIAGRAIYEGAFTVASAVELLRQRKGLRT
ncbi:MAG: 1-(5-phosphoribosyl)-5-[(5-phosphoribosylamino)methylideneamino]imidazole-4-carboxamide isomerase [Acidimicrobiia bacterium]|nr:1-(5-phosphoribosyl)-5-[(5-phosphoribosylamino)methylideneamino]imidazole-4-carboxamide isomerase [Acidimicrobiia bacterium]